MYNSPSGTACFDPAGLTKLSTLSFCQQKSILPGEVVFSPWLDTFLLPWWTHITKCGSLAEQVSPSELPQGCLHQLSITGTQGPLILAASPCNATEEWGAKLYIPMEGKISKEDSHGHVSWRLPLGSPALILLSQHLLKCLLSLILSKYCPRKCWWERAQMQCSKLRHKQNQNK